MTIFAVVLGMTLWETFEQEYCCPQISLLYSGLAAQDLIAKLLESSHWMLVSSPGQYGEPITEL